MKAYRLEQWKSDGVLTEVEEPEPRPGQVVVRIAGAGACHSDLHLMRDFEPGALPWDPPFTLGHENAGWVYAVGAGVSGVELEQPVAVYGPWGCGRCRRCRLGMENYCEHQEELGAAGGGLGRDGGMAPFMLVPDPRLLVPIDDLDPVDAAPLTDAGLTAYHAVKRSVPLLGPGSTAVVIGAGGLGHMAIQYLKALTPAVVIAVDRQLQALSLASEVGADHVVLASDDAASEIRDLSHGAGADAVLDIVGVDATLSLAAEVCRSLGHLTIVGIGGGTLPVGFFKLAYEVAVSTTYWGSLPELYEVVSLARQGKVRGRVHRFGLEDVAHAYAAMAEGRLEGRAVIVPSVPTLTTAPA